MFTDRSSFGYKKALLFIIAILTLVNGGMAFIIFYPGGRSKENTRVERMKRTEKELKQQVGFSDEQLKQYEVLRLAYGDSVDRQLGILRNLRSEFMELVYKKVDSAEIANATSKVCAAQKAVDQLVLKHFMTIRQLANNDQRERMDSFLNRITRHMLGMRTFKSH